MQTFDFSRFPDVSITGIDLSTLREDQLAVLYQQARYCQAMVDADIDTLMAITAADKTFTHMSGKVQSREEYFADIKNGRLDYSHIGIENPVVSVSGNSGSVAYTSVLTANAYGAQGTYRIRGTHWYEKRDGVWLAVDP